LSSNILSDLVKDGVLKRAKRGFYFRSKKTVLGKTSYTDIQLALLKAKSKCDFYCISGLAGYNELGLTTQVPNNIVNFSISLSVYKNSRFEKKEQGF